jgi:flagellar hook-basal body complex protein FliE
MKKQTAVEWLLKRFEDGDMYNVEDAQFIKHQALAMEKEQIKEAFVSGSHFEYEFQNAVNYYNKTYETPESLTEWMNGKKEDDIEKLAIKLWKASDDRTGDPPYIYSLGVEHGYNKAKETL